MSRLLVTLVILLVVVIGGLFLLGSLSNERPATTVEKQVSLANLQ